MIITRMGTPLPLGGGVTCLKVSANYFLGDLLVIFEAKYIGRKCLCHSIGINKICGNKSLSEHFEGNLSYISFEC